MGLQFQVRPVGTDPVHLNNYELFALARMEHRRGSMLHIEDDTYLRQVSYELDVARDRLGDIRFA